MEQVGIQYPLAATPSHLDRSGLLLGGPATSPAHAVPLPCSGGVPGGAAAARHQPALLHRHHHIAGRVPAGPLAAAGKPWAGQWQTTSQGCQSLSQLYTVCIQLVPAQLRVVHSVSDRVVVPLAPRWLPASSHALLPHRRAAFGVMAYVIASATAPIRHTCCARALCPDPRRAVARPIALVPCASRSRRPAWPSWRRSSARMPPTLPHPCEDIRCLPTLCRRSKVTGPLPTLCVGAARWIDHCQCHSVPAQWQWHKELCRQGGMRWPPHFWHKERPGTCPSQCT